MIDRLPKIQVDIDKDRIREIVSEALRMLHTYLGGEFSVSQEEVKQSLEKILSTEKVTTQFFLQLGSSKIPDLELRVDPIRRKVLCKSSFPKKTAKINYFMRIL